MFQLVVVLRDLMKWVAIVSTKFRFFCSPTGYVVLPDFDLYGGYDRYHEMGINCFNEMSVLVFRVFPNWICSNWFFYFDFD